MTVLSSDSLANWSGGQWYGTPPERVNGVSKDTRDLAQGSIYIAIKGHVHDGHEYVPAAAVSGAAAALVSDITPAMQDCGLPLLKVDDTLKSLWAIARHYRESLDVTCIAITGSTGKTTVKEMTWACCSEPGPAARTYGNWNNHIGVPLSLLAMPDHARYGVFEAGMNHPGELAPLFDMIQPKVGVVTNIGPVHLANFDSVDGIANEKAEVLRCLPKDGVAVLHKDDERYDYLVQQAPCPVVAVSMKQEADYQAEWVNPEMIRIFERSTSKHIDLPLPIPGEHNVVNLLLSCAAARSCGQTWQHILDGLSHYKSPPMRWEKQHLLGALFINDAYNANPMSMTAAISTFLSLPSKGRKWLVLGGMFELGDQEVEHHRRLGEFVGTHAVHGVVTVGSHGQWICDGIADSSGEYQPELYPCDTTLEAASVLKSRLLEGDQILVKGSRGARLENVLTLLSQSEEMGSLTE
jgi:UDP-N-acetylmuramoyl-tripeptide--D-alanyl-D-alanine ligase